MKRKNRQSPTYFIWHKMHQRCSNPKLPNYKNYGARGIKVCERWNLYKNFLEDMGERPEGFSLDRINNDGNYEPSNCRWADIYTQRNNTRVNNYISYNGETLTASQWARRLNVDRKTITGRIARGWSIEKTLTTRK